MTPVKDPPAAASRSQMMTTMMMSENHNPNHSTSSPMKKIGNSPITKSAAKKSAQKNPNQMISPRNKGRGRKFIVAKKNPKVRPASSSDAACKCKEKLGGDLKKCPCIAYQNLRASQEEFFRSRSSVEKDQENGQDFEEEEKEELKNCVRAENGEKEKSPGIENVETVDELEEKGKDLLNERSNLVDEMGMAVIKRRRDKLLEEARNSIPEDGMVKHLIRAFERLNSIPKKSKEKEDEGEGDCKKGLKWALPLPGMQQIKAPETEGSLGSFSPSELFFTSDNFGMDPRVSSSLDSSRGSFTSRRSSGGGHRSRRNSAESTGTFGGSKWKKKKQHKVTRQQPFKLRTEQRGRSKEEEFLRKVQEMFSEEEKLRIPLAQGLPWTTDEPECPAKPPVKESTQPIDLKLHSDVRAVERAEFDHYVSEKLNFIEQYRMERERQQKLEKEEEIKRLRKELVPKAQPMPYFDRPFIPQRSSKHPTIPKEPKFHIPQHKKIKCCMSWNDINIYDTQQQQ